MEAECQRWPSIVEREVSSFLFLRTAHLAEDIIKRETMKTSPKVITTLLGGKHRSGAGRDAPGSLVDAIAAASYHSSRRSIARRRRDTSGPECLLPLGAAEDEHGVGARRSIESDADKGSSRRAAPDVGVLCPSHQTCRPDAASSLGGRCVDIAAHLRLLQDAVLPPAAGTQVSDRGVWSVLYHIER